MRQPAHNQFVFADQLLAINPQVLPLFVRPAGYRQPPGDQRRGIFRPAGHNRDFIQVDIIALDDFLLTGGAAQAFGRHIQHLLELRQLIKQVAEAFWRLRFFQKGQQFTHLAQRTDILLPHPQRHATRRAEQIAQHRHGIAFRILKQQRRAAGAQSPVGNFGDFQVRIDRQSDTF